MWTWIEGKRVVEVDQANEGIGEGFENGSWGRLWLAVICGGRLLALQLTWRVRWQQVKAPLEPEGRLRRQYMADHGNGHVSRLDTGPFNPKRLQSSLLQHSGLHSGLNGGYFVDRNNSGLDPRDLALASAPYNNSTASALAQHVQRVQVGPQSDLLICCDGNGFSL